MDKFALFVFNIFINSFLVFFTTVLLIEGVIYLFRIGQGRCSAILHMIPFFKLVLDPFLYDFTRWAYIFGIDPLLSEEGSRMLSVWFGIKHFSWVFAGIEMTISGGNTFTLADILSAKIPLVYLYAFICLLCLTSLLCVYKHGKNIFHARVSFPGEVLSIENPALALYLQKHRIQVILTKGFLGSPCIIGIRSPTIYISDFYTLSLEEQEAIIAHEIEHFRHKDTLVKWILQCIQAIFFWIPTKWLQKKIEEGQEIGSDRGCLKQGIDPIYLATALHSVAKHSFCVAKQPLASYFTRCALYQRVHLLLHPVAERKFRVVFSALAMGLAFVMIFLGKFWIF